MLLVGRPNIFGRAGKSLFCWKCAARIGGAPMSQSYEEKTETQNEFAGKNSRFRKKGEREFCY